jgi:hypothetical protein
LITGLFMLPLAPVRGVIWVGERVLDQAESELNSPETIYRRLEEIDEARASGELSASESDEAETELVAQLTRVYGRGGPATT